MLTALLKVLFAGAMIYWLASSDKLDFNLLNKSIEQGPQLLIGILVIALIVVITAYRWKLLLEAKTDKKLSLAKIIPIHWIGLFFSTFLPGVVTGDVVKLLYIKDMDKNFNKAFLLSSVVIDRIIGLCGLLLLTGIVSALNYTDLVAHGPQIKHLINFNFLLSAGAIGFIICLFIPKSIQNKTLGLVDLIPFIGKKVSHLISQVWIFGDRKKEIFICLLISFFVHVISIINFYLITKPFYQVEIPLAHLYGFIPIGFISTAIPIAPAGAGVGHLVFDSLFGLFSIKGGASLFNLYFLCQVITNLIGFLPYILSNKKHSIKEAEGFEEAK
ncbi:lysylphosphatidylglycerol synthase transmembrane domain-containing protein [Bacteriovorax sp. Seq25_V]|uniref:lysylphosphatidylglycerol synthase transmembrane domain-containing protein n=1 Tax=Bacteriovorax sp. Seq25_V TaxID=1201288 RepID=UPI000389DD29|nr:lysylphosphatidylglycerol synthase transmembrane domain-containing protein [Bacteriovorax sp. Seq25_V]EQC44687.1 membrane protein, PF03706 family [Bacteriovorax sp. Seq25_V]